MKHATTLILITHTQHEESMSGLHEDEDSSEEIFVQNVVLDVVGVMLHAKGEELQDQA